MNRRLIAITALVLMLGQQAGWVAAMPMVVDPGVPVVEDCHDRESHHEPDDDPASNPLGHDKTDDECCEQQCNCLLNAQSGAITPTHFGTAPPASNLLSVYRAFTPAAPFQRLLRPPITA